MFEGKANYDRQITRGRNALKKIKDEVTGEVIKPRKIIKLGPKTYINGLIGESGSDSLKKYINANSVLLPAGVDLKKELKNWLDSIYDKNEIYVEERKKILNYMNKEMDKILDVLSQEEILNVLCIG